jgi:glutamine amidotransferase/cyclase
MISDDPSLFEEAKILIFPGVGAFGQAIRALDSKGFIEPLRKYLLSGKPFLGICIGLQILFESSEESPGLKVSLLPQHSYLTWNRD